MNRMTSAAIVAASLALSACSTVQGARERIVRYVSPCESQTVAIYFETDQADLTPEGQRVIAEAAQNVRSCRVERVSVLGLADAAGDPNANLALSKRRADSVAAALALAQLPTATFEVSAVGQAGAITTDGKAAPLRRRAEVTLHVARR